VFEKTNQRSAILHLLSVQVNCVIIQQKLFSMTTRVYTAGAINSISDWLRTGQLEKNFQQEEGFLSSPQLETGTKSTSYQIHIRGETAGI
jgi:hypothetical protein